MLRFRDRLKSTLCIITFLLVVPYSLPALTFNYDESSISRMKMISSNTHKACELYSRLEKMTEPLKKPTTVAKNHPHLNRYSSFLPFDETRSCREIDNFYICASDVCTPLQKYIIAQAPIKETVADFWKMILYKNCSLIVTACMPIEFRVDKCTPYWQKSLLPKKVLEWNLSLLQQTILKNGIQKQRIVERIFEAANGKTNEIRIIKQLHFENWPDLGVPDLELFQSYLELVDEHSCCPQEPILVHCSAGIGRSGTFVATHSLRKELLSGAESINIPQRIYDLRSQRAHLVTNPSQFQFIYKVLLQTLPTIVQ